MSLAFDEYGRPFIVLKEQDTKRRIKGIEAIKVLFTTYSATSLLLSPSLLPLDPLSAPRDWISF
jgi:T-complex protein 1 subunit epsilon